VSALAWQLVTYRSPRRVKAALKAKRCESSGCKSAVKYRMLLAGIDAGCYCTSCRGELEQAWATAMGAV
jgi:hypothetical protein